MSYVIANRQGCVMELVTGESYPAAGVLLQGDNATAFETQQDAEDAIWNTISWAERLAEREDRKRFAWATESNYRLLPLRQEVSKELAEWEEPNP